tara:strand:- start:10 stop:540 length:531 start_codon:yes stop_codon:yes gene_type:complete
VVKPVVLIVGAIPVIFAMLIVIPMFTTEIPTSAINPNDTIEIEYTKHHLTVISFGVTEKTIAENTQILAIKNDGSVEYNEIKDGNNQSHIMSSIDTPKLQKLTALIKETGFMSIQKEQFPILDDVTDYTKSAIKVTLNGNKSQIFWPEQSVTDKLIPPIITMIESELDKIINRIIE